MHRIQALEQAQGFALPRAYKALLGQFERFMLLARADFSFDLLGLDALFSTAMGKGTPEWAMLQYMVQAHAHKYPAPGLVYRHDGGAPLAAARVQKGFVFGSQDDGTLLYLDVKDGMSLWRFRTDEGSTGQVAPSFDALMTGARLVAKE